MRRLISLTLVVVLGLAVASCGGDDASDEPLVFGEGEIPSTFPDDFPIPPGSVIGSTLVDRVSNRSEASLRVPAAMVSTVQYFTVGLVNEGFVIDLSEGSAAEWTLKFSDGGMTGLIKVSGTASGLSLAVVTLNQP